MRLVATADLHGNLPRVLPDGDVLIIAGDVCPHEDHRVVFQRDWLENEFSGWLTRMRKQHNFQMILGVAGNHDKALFADRRLGYELPWTYLSDEWVRINGITFWGSPWTACEYPEDSPWVFHKNNSQMWEMTWTAEPTTNVLISHAPPYRLCDLTGPRHGTMNAGFPGWNAFIKQHQPELFICGHIHTGYGWNEVKHAEGNVTRVCNVALCEDPPHYAPRNPPIVLDLDDRLVTMPNVKAWIGE